MLKVYRIFFAFFFFIPTLGFSKSFKTPFIRFELPPNWDCKQEEAADWVCQPDDLAQRSEAIVVVVTKEANEVDDKIDIYNEYLKAPRDMRDLIGKAYKSDVKFSKIRKITDHDWVDSLHLGSEIPGFFTRYLATRKEKISALVTYSVAESVYPKYASQLDLMVDTLKVEFDPQAFEEARRSNPSSLLASRAKSLRSRMDPSFESDKAPANASNTSSGGLDTEQIVAIMFLIGVVGFVIYRRKQKKF